MLLFSSIEMKIDLNQEPDENLEDDKDSSKDKVKEFSSVDEDDNSFFLIYESLEELCNDDEKNGNIVVIMEIKKGIK